MKTELINMLYINELWRNYYTPFGMLMPNRHQSSPSYKYGFNGKEKDDELKGNGNSYDFGARIYDSRIGRFLTVDKMFKLSADLTPYRFAFNDPIRIIDRDGNYETDGHYWTVYLIARQLGIDDQTAKTIAYYAQLPDAIIHGKSATLTNTWLNVFEQNETHAITGEYAHIVKFETEDALGSVEPIDYKEVGRLIHKYGDCFAHRRISDEYEMYGRPFGHWREDEGGHASDLIYIRPLLYLDYIEGLSKVLADIYGKNVDNANLGLLANLSSYAANNKISLIGILNYEVAKFNGECSFEVQFESGFLNDLEGHRKHVENTKKYLDSKGVKYTTTENYEGLEDSNILNPEIPITKPKYIGTTFNLQE